MFGESLYIPFVGAIIEKDKDGKKYVLVQTRQKLTDAKYSGTLEIPGGKFRAFEDVYETVRREVKEECGLIITEIKDENKRITVENKDDESDLVQPFCVTQMKNGPFVGLIFLCRAKGEPLKETNETKDCRWIEIDELRRVVKDSPEKIYTAFLGPLKYYLGV